MAVQSVIKRDGNTALNGNDVLQKSMGSDRINVGTVVKVETPSVSAPRDTPSDNGGGSTGVREMPATPVTPVTPPANTVIPPELNEGSERNPLNSEVIDYVEDVPFIPADGEHAADSFEEDDPDGLSDGLEQKKGQGGKGIMVDDGLRDDYYRYGEFGSQYGSNGQDVYANTDVQPANYNYRGTSSASSTKKNKIGLVYIAAGIVAVVGLYFLFREKGGKRR